MELKVRKHKTSLMELELHKTLQIGFRNIPNHNALLAQIIIELWIEGLNCLTTGF